VAATGLRGLRQAARRMLDVVSKQLADQHEADQLEREEKRAEAETWMQLWDNADGTVSGREGRTDAPDLTVHVDVPTWRALNRGEISAPEALLRRRLRISGNLVLALKLHLILG